MGTLGLLNICDVIVHAQKLAETVQKRAATVVKFRLLKLKDNFFPFCSQPGCFDSRMLNF